MKHEDSDAIRGGFPNTLAFVGECSLKHFDTEKSGDCSEKATRLIHGDPPHVSVMQACLPTEQSRHRLTVHGPRST